MNRVVPAKWLLAFALAFCCACLAPTVALAADEPLGVSGAGNDPTDKPIPAEGVENDDVEEEESATEGVGQDVKTNPVTTPDANAKKGESQENTEEAAKEAAVDTKTDEPKVAEAGDNVQNKEGDQKLLAMGTADAGNKAAASTPVKLVAQAQETAPDIKLGVRAHVQNDGWKSWVYVDGTGREKTVGTTGRSLRLEELVFSLAGVAGGVQVQAHVQNIGWQAVGSSAGTHGRSLRIEAVRLILTGEASRWYDISYRAHVQNKGWMSWTSNGGMAGTTGQSLRIEALQIKLTKKAGKSSATEGIVGVRAQAHVQDDGWGAWVQNGEMAGSSGRSLRMEALRLQVDAGIYGGGIQCRAHVQNKGWMSYRSGMSGTTGQSLRMEALQIKLTGNLAKSYDVVYRAHVQNVGWQAWTVNGGTAGTTGKSLRVEAIEVKLVKKNSAQNLSEGTYFITFATDPNKAYANSNSSSGAQTQVAGYADNLPERYYLRKESGGTISLQSVNSGMFLASSGGKLVQLPDSSASSHRWKLSWNGGYTLTNAAGGAARLSGSKVTVASGGSQWMFTGTSIVPDGTYTVKNAAAGKMLDVTGGSASKGANVRVLNANNGGSQAFEISRKSGNTYYVKNVNSGMAVEVGNASKANGANVRQWTSNGSAAQQWKISLSRSGGLQFTNVASGKVMTAAGKGGSGSNVSSNNNSNAATQRWTLSASSYRGDSVVNRARSIIGNLSSDTSYFIAVDLTNSRTLVFRGSAGNWSLDKNWVVSTGAPDTPTVVGDYTIQSRGYSFGDGYTCYYWTQFYGDFLFHSILYDEGTFNVQDGRLGYSISHGCVRMNIDHAEWIYDNVPQGTHVKTYY